MLEGYFLAVLVIGYFLGSINFSIVIGKFYKIDIRQHGSGNAGMTNALRTLGKKVAIMVMIGDMLKGVVACIIGGLILPEMGGYQRVGLVVAGFGALLGHNWPVFFGFRGGKGVLTTFAVLLMMDYRLGIIIFAIFAIVVFFTRYISLGSMIAAIFFPILSWIFKDWFNTNLVFTAFASLVALIVILKHRSNIERLIAGKENKFSLKKKEVVAHDK